jgi:hypothetical protein
MLVANAIGILWPNPSNFPMKSHRAETLLKLVNRILPSIIKVN